MSGYRCSLRWLFALASLTTIAMTSLPTSLASPAVDAVPDALDTDQAASSDSGSIVILRQVMASGGGRSQGGAYSVLGTIGQPDVTAQGPLAGGVFAVSGGFWSGVAVATPDGVFADGFESQGE